MSGMILIMAIIGLIMVIAGSIGAFMVIIEDLSSGLFSITLMITLIGGMLLFSSISSAYTDSVQNITISGKFTNHDAIPSNGFIDVNNTEYYYDNDMSFDINKTYKVKISRNNNVEINVIKYIYQ